MEGLRVGLQRGGLGKATPVPGAPAGRAELVLSLQPFAYSRLGGSGELLGGSEGGPEGARGRFRGPPRTTFQSSRGSVGGFSEICWHISRSSGHLGSWLRRREHDSSCLDHHSSGSNHSSKCLNAKSERAILKLLTARSSSGVQPRFRHAPISAEALVSGCSERFLEAG